MKLMEVDIVDPVDEFDRSARSEEPSRRFRWRVSSDKLSPSCRQSYFYRSLFACLFGRRLKPLRLQLRFRPAKDSRS
jgi:hypothetical protein